MSQRVTLVQGGGIGYDQMPAVLLILQEAGADLEFEEYPAGLAAIERGLPPLSEEMFAAVRRNGLALKTKLALPPQAHAKNYNLLFRRALNLFASVRPVKNIRGLPARFDDVDILIIRELTEDLYASIEHEIVPGVVQSIKVVTEAACRRFFRFALEWAREAGRKTVHCVHKANILKLADGLYLDVFREVARDYPELTAKEIIVDNCCMQMVSRPQQFDVMVLGNLYGDLMSDLGAGIVGGISATAGINVGEGVRVFECFHGGRREDIGANRANPLPLLWPGVDLLLALGQGEPARRITAAVEAVLQEGKVRTPDLGGRATTTQMAEAIVGALP